MVGHRKFILALIATISAFILCKCHCLSGVEWMSAQTLILGLYKTADVLNRKNNPNAVS